VEMLSISVDSHFVHKMWHDNELSKMVEGGVPFPMLSDQGGKIGSIYGVSTQPEIVWYNNQAKSIWNSTPTFRKIYSTELTKFSYEMYAEIGNQ
jgi:alkyl hydroperoxide reductase subunit AhpC